ncbi:N-acetyl-alpha-D-glucosaminyl L-malate synthase BshA [candidate division TA06 bacterium]|nr:N-acetyl-alpha-D-glucosaminyl L-malate synthase BshA [candidate division TA06 bacterium]
MFRIGITSYPTYGGSGVVAAELGRALSERGHIVHFISYAPPPGLGSPSGWGGFGDRIFFHEVEVLSYPLFEHSPYPLSLAVKMAEVANYVKLDLLHVHYAIPHAVSAILAKMMIKDRDLKVITTLHGTDVTLVGNDRSFLPITRWSIEESDGVTAISDYLKERTLRELVIEKEIERIYNFVDTEKFNCEGAEEHRKKVAPKGEKILTHISNFRPVKRVEDVVRIFHLVHQKIPSKLLLVGDGPDRSKAEGIARDLAIIEDVIFTGKEDSVQNCLAVSDLLLLPSELESFGLVALEAMSCQVPVIAANTGGLPEVMVSGEMGYLVEIGDVEGMARRALEILADDKKKKEMGEKGRERAVSQFDMDKIVPLYEAYYEKILKG